MVTLCMRIHSLDNPFALNFLVEVQLVLRISCLLDHISASSLTIIKLNCMSQIQHASCMVMYAQVCLFVYSMQSSKYS